MQIPVSEHERRVGIQPRILKILLQPLSRNAIGIEVRDYQRPLSGKHLRKQAGGLREHSATYFQGFGIRRASERTVYSIHLASKKDYLDKSISRNR